MFGAFPIASVPIAATLPYSPVIIWTDEMTIAAEIDAYLKTQLQNILIGQSVKLFNGKTYPFRTNAGRLVDSQLEYTEHPDDMPALVLYSGKNSSSVEGAELGSENHLQEISIEGFISCDKAGTEGDDLKRDITAVVKADPWFGDLIMGMQGFETDVAIQIGDEVFAVVKVSFTVQYSAPFGSE